MSANLKSSQDGTKAIIGVNGGEQFKVSSAGDVEIAGKIKSQSGAALTSDSPMVVEVNSSQPALRVTQTGSGHALLVEDAANPDSTPFSVDSAGNIRTSGSLACLISGSNIGQELTNGNFSGMTLNYDSNSKGPQLQLKGVSGCYIDMSPTPEPGVSGQPNDFVFRLFNTRSSAHVIANADSNLFVNSDKGAIIFGNSGTKVVASYTNLYNNLSSANGTILPTHGIDFISNQSGCFRTFTFGSEAVTRHFMADGTPWAPVACGNGAYIASMRGFAYSGNNQFKTYGMGGNASVDIRTVGAQSSTNCGGEISFATHPANVGNTGGVERMVITSEGNIGVGTATPDSLSLVHLKKTIFNDDVQLQIENTSPSGYSTLSLGPITTLNGGGGTSRHGDVGIWRMFSTDNGGSLYGGLSSLNIGSVFQRNVAIITNNQTRMVITSAGNVGIGVTQPAFQMQLSTDSAAKPSTTTWTVASDERIKENIEVADIDRCYEIVKGLPLKRYSWKQEVFSDAVTNDRSKLGWIAQDVEEVFPKAVNTIKYDYDQVFENVKRDIADEKGNVNVKMETRLVSQKTIEDLKTLNADQIYAVMYGAIQKLMSVVEQQQEDIKALKAGNK